jgi:Fe2+ transport system protein FeoA
VGGFMVLSACMVGKCCEVTDICLEPNLKKHVQGLGIHKNGRITLIARTSEDTMIASIKGAKIALGEDIVNGIYVSNERCGFRFLRRNKKEASGRGRCKFYKGLLKRNIRKVINYLREERCL